MATMMNFNKRSENILRDPKSILSGRFGHPYGRPGDSFRIWETPRQSGRVGIYAISNSEVQMRSFFSPHKHPTNVPGKIYPQKTFAKYFSPIKGKDFSTALYIYLYMHHCHTCTNRLPNLASVNRV